MQTTRKHPAGGKPAMTMIAAGVLAAALAACGGTPPRTLNVVAATGKALAASVVTVRDASKNVVGSGTTDANGKAAVTLLESAAAPFLVSVAAPSGATLYAVTLLESAVNLTPLTSVIAMQLLGNAPASATAAQLAVIDASKLATAQGQLATALAGALQAKGVSAGYDFVNGSLAPGSSDPADALLDAVQVKVNGADVDIVNASGTILAQMTGGGVPVASGNSIDEPALNLSARQQALIATAAGTDTAPALLQVGLDELHPTQPAVGYDQIYYKLGRYGAEDLVMAKTNKPKKFADLCEANGQGDVVAKTSNVAGATLINPPPAFQCKSAPGSSPADMKTVVIGPKGKLYLTDGHHTFTGFWDADGGANHQLKVWVKVTANLSGLNEYDFWALMKKTSRVWLRDGNNQPIVTSQLPRQIGLKSLGNDPYRSLVYYTRDAAYIVPAASTEFLEFYWADWLRNKPVLDLSTYNLSDAASYSAAILKASQAMVALKPSDVVSNGLTAATLGWSGVLNTAALDDLVSGTGKLTYAIAYKKSIGK
ncbi:ParB-like protein [Janthinobacterium agaricidamnosum]|uniref:ParB-like nuclease family protein n=1 Tax=Janthinobacterium agaricidamnosum NBRC 102515 = DSM 9628 TaxID=1349767 RepID=W0V4C9_9BURK|nr:ParB-like protein [Janthinobacterium agaricidamnosum]CDG83689.1 parB-like nuclease family protein [Janthinobacterium agaricidamnosum NBRC 102515 = DSM 9628]